MKSFLISNRGGLGDFIFTWPSILRLRKHYPELCFKGLGRPDFMRLARSFGIIDSILDSESALYLDFFGGESLPESLQDVEAAALWLADPAGPVSLLGNIARHPVINIRPFQKKPVKHMSEYYYEETLRMFNLEYEDIMNFYPMPEKDPDGRLACIHPGSGSSKKNLAPEFYLQLVGILANEMDFDVKFILGPAEIERGEEGFFSGFGCQRPENLAMLKDLLSGCSLFVGNDSGVSHLSGFMGVTTFAIYSTTDPAIWGVKGKNVINLITGRLAS